ncbi:hypothetical protein RB213_003633 [Colletotrichum asianum]
MALRFPSHRCDLYEEELHHCVPPFPNTVDSPGAGLGAAPFPRAVPNSWDTGKHTQVTSRQAMILARVTAGGDDPEIWDRRGGAFASLGAGTRRRRRRAEAP